MKQNTFISLSILTLLVLALNVVSASDLTISLNQIVTPNVAQGDNAIVTLNVIDNNANNDITGISFSGASGSTSLSNSSSQLLNVSIPISPNNALGAQAYSIYATGIMNGTQLTSNTISITLNVNQSQSNKILSDICGGVINTTDTGVGDLEDQTLDNKNEFEWTPLNNVRLRLNEVQNKDPNKDHDYSVTLLFYRSDGSKVSADSIVTNSDDLVQDISINSDDSKDVTFNFQVDGQVKEDTYDIYAKVKRSGVCYATKVGEAYTSKDDYRVVISDITAPTTANCGDTVALNVKVSDIGSNDEDKVKVDLYNSELGINTFQEIDNLAEGDSATAVFTFAIPSTAVQKMYGFFVSTEYRYDSNTDTYRKINSDDNKIYNLNLIDGCVDPTRPTITATLANAAQVGKDVNISIAVKNNANSSNSFLLTADNYNDWASSATFSPSVFNLAKQATQTVTLTLSPTQSGSKTFTLRTVYNGKTVDQIVSVNIASKQESAISNYFANMKDGNVTAWLVTGIVVLIVLILIIILLRLLL